MIHWCQDETNAVLAAIPLVGFFCLKCKQLYYKIRGRHDHHKCSHKEQS
jgi:hypothetical protein